MAQKTRSQLKSLFETGKKPSQQDFADFIDSTLNRNDDGIEKPSGADTPLKISAQGADEKLLDFYRGEAKTWSISQKSGDEEGLNISNPGGSRLFINSSNGNVGISTYSPQAKLEVKGDLKLQSGVAVNNISSDGTLAGNSDLTIPTEKAVKTYANTQILASTNPMSYRMYPDNPIVYQDIFNAKDDNAIKKLGNPSRYDDTKYKTNPWNDRRIICYGGNNDDDGNGAEVTIPAGYNTVWVRVLGERWNIIKAYFLDGNQENLGLWSGGVRKANCYCPDGSLSDSYYNVHQWLPIPTGRSGRLALIAKPNTNLEFWISGLAFSTNPWDHATQSGVGYHWASNGGDELSLPGDGIEWNNDLAVRIAQKTNPELKVPVVPSGQDKLLYIVEHNNNWNGCMHNNITVNGQSIERLLATYDNPFARHWNSKIYNRYIAARIPASLIGNNDRYLSVIIDMSKQNNYIYFREIGTHNFDMPQI